MKDNFSIQSEQYLQFRPTYPNELYEFLLSLIETKDAAWDCGTGNGQVALELAKHFKQVYATDISEKQIKNAIQRNNILYKVEAAEDTSFPDKRFDLITVAQAIHWFDFDAFYKEVKRTIKPNGVFAVIGYALLHIDDGTDKIIKKFHDEIVGPFWDPERRYIDEHYQTIPFPFKEIQVPQVDNVYEWRFEQLIGYLNTWSAVQHYIKANGTNPVDIIYNNLKNTWKKDELKTVRFPILLRVGQQP